MLLWALDYFQRQYYNIISLCVFLRLQKGVLMKQKTNKQGYPINLLSKLFQMSFSYPIAQDRLNGIEYAISTLPENGRRWISLRFRDGVSAEQTAQTLGLTLAQERELEQDTVRKLRYTSRWDWIAYGIEGNVKRIKTQVRAEAYEEGYRKGLEDGHGGKVPHTPDAATLALPISALSLPNRTRHSLTMDGRTTVGSLADMNQFQIMRIRGLGAGGAEKVGLALRQLGIFGTTWEKYIRACR